MKRFVKLHGENAWVNLLSVDGIAIRPQLKAVGHRPPGEVDPLEERHEPTGLYEVVILAHGRTTPIREFPSQAEAEAFILHTLAELGQ